MNNKIVQDRRMKQFYETYKDADEKLLALLRQINWTNNGSRVSVMFT